jgi:pyrroloquinoline-quinone synthase
MEKNNIHNNDNLRLLIKTIDNEISKKSLLNHQFYNLWREGKLTLNHLRGYSKEYFQLVKTVPEFVQNIYNNLKNHDSPPYYLKAIKKTQIEESDHIEPWTKFALSLGIEKRELLEYDGKDEVNMAIENLKKLSRSSLLEGASTMYSFEKELPQISKNKIEGLQTFYGISKEDAITYFKIHEFADIEHAELWKTIILDSEINKIIDKNSPELILKASINSLIAQNQILDSVYETYVKDTII